MAAPGSAEARMASSGTGLPRFASAAARSRTCCLTAAASARPSMIRAFAVALAGFAGVDADTMTQHDRFSNRDPQSFAIRIRHGGLHMIRFAEERDIAALLEISNWAALNTPANF